MNALPSVSLQWLAGATPSELHGMLRALGQEYPVQELSPGACGPVAAGAGVLRLEFESEPGLAGFEIRRDGAAARIRYGRLAAVGRALGALLSGLAAAADAVADRPAFRTLGIVLDCGHNATVTTAHCRRWLRRLALLGFDTAMVYTEAGYELPGEGCFGYMRGAYTASELRELDAYAADLGIEMVGCIQALGHLEQVLKWPPYAGVRDTDHVLLVGAPETDALVEKMVAHWAGVFRSRRLHLGMDETYDIGRGGYLDRHGYRPGLEIYLDHLERAVASCRRHGLRPMIWSDVLFRLSGASVPHGDAGGQLADAVRARLPKDVDLVYWDYYHDRQEHYLGRIRQHRELGCEPVMASAVWSWPTFWHDARRTERFGGACIDACRQAGLAEMLFALWTDDGAYGDIDSALAGLTFVAEKSWGDGAVDEDTLARRFRGVCGADLAAHRVASHINEPLQTCCVIWDDPLQAIYLRYVARQGRQALAAAVAHYRGVATALEPHRGNTVAGDLGHAWLVARVLAAKVDLAARLFAAHAADDRAALAAVRDEAPAVAALMEELAQSLRRVWLAHCQPFGLEVIQIRMAGQAARYRELAARLGEYLSGGIAVIPELDEGRKEPFLPMRHLSYRSLASGARVF